MENHVAILGNEKGQPSRPADKQILVTIAHGYPLAPLICTNWSKVPQKDEMWGYKNEESRLPSKTRMFEETKKRKEACTYKRSNDDILNKIVKFIDPIRVSLREEMQNNFDALEEKMDVELQVKKDKLANLQKELDAQKVELDAQQADELDAQKTKVDHVLVHLQKMIPGITPKIIAQAVTS
ncbi:hypothetical protein Cgig2_027281 [Carnegiea gigantea]|uniref:Uncharacterized protein n=1 Tax=Carnegiea gigantea TaxID=171969 RepID=A0A9Q1QBU3_9CARY|nr:hypothetical protein Cgig2_027281 [Carnegiea gigantea]